MRTIIRNNYDPHLGDYHERIVQDDAREKTWLFDCDGVYLDITAGRGDTKVVNELGDSETDAASQKLVTDELAKKQDTLVAGDNITIEGNVISAGGGAYTAGYGLTLTGTEFAANTSVLATKTDLAGKQDTLTTGQLAAVNSGIDSTKVGQIATNTSAIAGKQDALNAAQLTAVNSGIDSTKVEQIATNAGDITTINGKIPAQATSSNQLADKDFVNSSIATNTANFIGTFNSVAELEAYSGTVTNNDYAFVIVTDGQGNTAYDRYKYNGSTSDWLFEYELNNSSFTAEQWASINSGITSGDVTKLSGIAAGAEVNVQSNWNETDTSSDAYIQNKPTIPTVNDATLTITQNGTSIGTFTANASTDATIALTDTTYSAFTGATASTAGTAGLVPAPVAGDESKVLKGDGTWAIPEEGIKTLTTADYNYPINNPTAIAPWLLQTGIYKIPEGVNFRKVSSGSANSSRDRIVIVTDRGTSTSFFATAVIFQSGSESGDIIRYDSTGQTYNSWLGNSDETAILNAQSIRDDLMSNETLRPLSANQGRILNNNKANKTAFTGTDGTATGVMGLVPAPATTDAGKVLSASGSWAEVPNEIIQNAGAPTTSTAGTLGQLLTDTTNAKLYQLTAIDTTDPDNPSYTWTEVGGSSINVVQTTGLSTTDVMSQNAATKLVFPLPGSAQISIGQNSSGTNTGANAVAIGGDLNSNYGAQARARGAVAIGNNSAASANYAIAIGTGANATVTGQFDIGTTWIGPGYNNSNYRLLTGVYDGQSAHDAATYGQLNTRLGGMTILQITQTDYDALATKDPNTLYVITGA